MIRIRCTRVLDADYTPIMVYYPDDLRFDDEKWVEEYRKKVSEYWDGRTVDIDYFEIPKTVEVIKIVQYTAAELGLTMDAMFGKTRNPEVVFGRMVATQICLDAHIPPSHIEEKTPWINRVYAYYRNELSKKRETYPKIDQRYKEIFDKVMTKLKSDV